MSESAVATLPVTAAAGQLQWRRIMAAEQHLNAQNLSSGRDRVRNETKWDYFVL